MSMSVLFNSYNPEKLLLRKYSMLDNLTYRISSFIDVQMSKNTAYVHTCCVFIFLFLVFVFFFYVVSLKEYF